MSLKILGRASSVAIASAATAAVTIATLSLVDRSPSIGIATLLAAGLLAVAFSVPTHWLPAAALILYATVPAKVLPDTPITSVVPLGTVLLVVWRLRVFLTRSLASTKPVEDDNAPNGAVRAYAGIFAGLFTGWAVIAAITHSTTIFGLGWLFSFVAAIFAALTVRAAPAEAALVLRTWIVLGGAAGAYALLELVLGASPLFGSLYNLLGVQSSQHWSVYRAEVSFSHPLFAGAFLSVAATLGVIRWLETGKRATLLLGMLAAAGVVATLSRGSMIATVIAVTVGTLLVSLARGRRGLGRYVLLLALAAGAIFATFQLDAFSERAASTEALRSAGARDAGWVSAMQAAEYSGFLGTGPATSGQTASLFGTVIIENSYLQLLISLGLPGLLLFAFFLVAVFVRGLQARRFASASALIAIGVALAGFNALDAVRSMHLVLGLVVFVALHAPEEVVRTPIFRSRRRASPELVSARATNATTTFRKTRKL
ncbi:O-antigen ligase [Microbacterium paludicola]|uniref:O-antigen ligase family protein n=1 Tax=Microbacterium paludicola TaxID=300019 RepID=UPI0011A09FFB|nr:O-antigen ligase family protein [Microbacterium paludicola]